MSIGDPLKDRLTRAQKVLREHGLLDATVDAEGGEREIAAVRVPAAEWERLVGDDGARLSDDVKAAGFRYVALDLRPSDHTDSTELTDSTDSDEDGDSIDGVDEDRSDGDRVTDADLEDGGDGTRGAAQGA